MNQFQSLPYTPVAKMPSDKSSVLLVKAKNNSTQYIMKTFPVSLTGKVQYYNERLISKLSHPYIIKMKESYDRLHSVVLEHAPNGDFCELLMSGTKLPEIIARTYFHQLLEGIDYLHKNGIAHLDLKLDNLLLAANRSMKIIDFDLAQKIDEEKRNYARGKGTSNYRAPELRARKCNNFKAADIYSMGVIMFSLYTNLPPYTENDKGECDTWYQFLMNDQAQYWSKLSKFVNISDDFKELFVGMVCEHPDKRMDISQIRASKWFNGPILSDQELDKEMQKICKTK